MMQKLAMLLAMMSLTAGAARCTGAELNMDLHIAGATSQTAQDAEQFGDLARLKQDYGKAAVEYQRALRLDPRNSLIYNKLGIVELKIDDLRGARKSFDLALRYDARNKLALNNLGAVDLLERRYKQAIRYLKRSLALDEANASAHLNLAEAWMGMKKVDRAMTEYSRALELDPDILSSSNDGVMALVRTQQQEALIDFLIAKAYAQRGNTDGALDYLQRARDRNYPH